MAEMPLLLQLNDGSTGQGKIISISDRNTLTWLNEGFEQPFEFPLQTIRSICRPEDFAPTRTGQTRPPTGSQRLVERDTWMITLRNGNQFVGYLKAVTEDYIDIDTEPFERVRVRRSQVRSVARPAKSNWIAASNRPVQWNTTGSSSNWTLTKFGLSTQVRDAAIEGDVGIPGPIEVRLRLRWEGAANFSISIGEKHAVTRLDSRDQERKRDNRIVRNTAGTGYAITLDAWADKLFFVGGERKVLSVVPSGNLGGEAGCLDAILRLDPSLGTAELQLIGQPSLSLTCPESATRPFVEKIHITNKGDLLSVDFLAIRRWEKELEAIETAAKPQVMLTDRSTISGGIRSWDTQSGKIELETSEGTRALLAEQLLAGRMARLPPGTPRPTDGSTENQSPGSQRWSTSPSADEFIFTLSDESLIIGRILTADGENLIVKILGIDKEVTLAVERVVGMTRYQSNVDTKTASSNSALQVAEQLDRFDDSDSELSPSVDLVHQQKRSDESGAEGIALLGTSQIRGTLLAETPAGNRSALYWQPTSSQNPSPIRTDIKGEIRFINRPPQPEASKLADSAALGASQLREHYTPEGFSTVEDQRHRAGKRLKSESTWIEFTTGDTLPTVITGMDQNGVSFESPNSSLTFAHNHQLHRVTFALVRLELVLSEEQRERLLTFPRSFRDDPPTHLIVSTTGDVLRANVQALENGEIVAEVRGNTVRLSTGVISEIIWLHQVSPVERLPPSEGRIRILTKERFMATLCKSRITGGELLGSNEIFGELQICIDQLEKISFGQHITPREFLLRTESAPPTSP